MEMKEDCLDLPKSWMILRKETQNLESLDSRLARLAILEMR